MALTENPSNTASYYSCNHCGIHAQVLVQAKDAEGNDLYDENWQPVMVNDEPAASAEINEHIEKEHRSK